MQILVKKTKEWQIKPTNETLIQTNQQVNIQTLTLSVPDTRVSSSLRHFLMATLYVSSYLRLIK